MEKTAFAVAKFSYSKNDFYAVTVIKRFNTLEQAKDFYDTHSYATSSGGTWQEAYDYHIIEIKDDVFYYLNGGKIQTILD